jgi:hypothetical protein
VKRKKEQKISRKIERKFDRRNKKIYFLKYHKPAFAAFGEGGPQTKGRRW